MDPVTTKIVSDVIVAGFVKPIADNVISPRIKEWADTKSDAKKADAFIANIDEYLKEYYKRYRVLSSLIFNREGIDLFDVYEPVAISKISTSRPYTIIVKEFPSQFRSYRGFLITDSAGMGKSTVMKYLFLKAIEGGEVVPIFIELRRLSESNSILSLIKQDIGGSFSDISDRSLLSLINSEKFIIFLDGFDEIQSSSTAIPLKVREFVNEVKKARVIITTRPDNVESLFPDLSHFQIKPLSKEQAFSIIRRISKDEAISEKLIQELGSIREVDKGILDFLKNPMLTSLLYKAYEHKPSLPEQKHLFYDNVFDALYETHDSKKDGVFRRTKLCGLNTSRFKRITSILAHFTMFAGKTEFSLQELKTFIDMVSRVIAEFSFDTDKYFDDLHKTVPLFVKEGQSIRWSHKSLQDFFVAYYIGSLSNDPLHVMKKIFDSPHATKYYNTFDMLKEMKPSFLESNFVIPYLKSYLEIPSEDIVGRALFDRTLYSVEGFADISKDIASILSKSKGKSLYYDSHIGLISSSSQMMAIVKIILSDQFKNYDGMLKNKHHSKFDVDSFAYVVVNEANFDSLIEISENSYDRFPHIIGREDAIKFIEKYENAPDIGGFEEIL